MRDMQTVPSQSEIYIHARETKMLIWSDLDRSGCRQLDGRLALRADGTGTWTCATSSSNPFPGDIWHTNFCVNDRNGVTLFGAGPFYSPRMCFEDGVAEYRWSATFSFSADLFPAIHAGVQHCGTLPPACVLRMDGPSIPRPPAKVEGCWHRSEIPGLLTAYA